MTDRPETWAWLSAWLESNWPAIYSGMLAFIIASLRIIYGGGGLRRILMEAPLCGFLAMASSYGLEVVGLHASASPFFGGAIGLLGVEGTRAAAKRFIERKADSL